MERDQPAAHDATRREDPAIEPSPAVDPSHAVERSEPGGHNVDLDAFRDRSLNRGVNPVIYWTLRSLLVPGFLIYLRMQRVGREHLPKQGPLLLASNHRSFLDPFLIGTCLRRPIYYFAKRELFEKPWQAWILNSLGAFPVDRGAGDRAALDTAREILERGDCVVVFPEGTRIHGAGLGVPRRGIGRLALETGVPVVPIAVIGSEHVRRGWRIRPRKVRVRVGPPLRFPTTGAASRSLAAAVTERIWACVSLQWEWLGGARSPERDEPIADAATVQTPVPAAKRRLPTTFVRGNGSAAPEARDEREQTTEPAADGSPHDGARAA
ncbi:MAG TPA: lysophospholipid acyltransferase family protein [Solirubrobacteraceae bacterium]|jgi:1-acyl-sn-glycerol-3-phosphate acyltransferase